LAFVAAGAAAYAATQHQESSMSKKVIECGQDIPSPAYVQQHLRTMEQRPFDGVVMRLSSEVGAGNVFDAVAWDAAAEGRSERQRQELETLSSIGWGERFTDNFVIIYARSTMDWFSDADWAKVLENVSFCARAAQAGHCKGVLWDPEPYGATNPWVWEQQPGHEGRSFADYERIVRKRGAQFMRALQEEFPGLHVLSMRILSDFAEGSPFCAPLLRLRDPRRTERLAHAYYGLHPAFFNGMLDAVAPEVAITDANEDAYFYASALEYFRAYKVLRQDALALVAPENHRTYRSQVRIGHAASVDYVVGRWAGGLSGFPRALTYQGLELTPEQQAQWFEHSLYYALETADEYVWVWTERPLNWWTGEGIPAGMEQAVRSAKTKHERGEPLGFAVEEMLAEARARAKQGE
jgi:hypothetical protein